VRKRGDRDSGTMIQIKMVCGQQRSEESGRGTRSMDPGHKTLTEKGGERDGDL
jgi:hypothetical protein